VSYEKEVIKQAHEFLAEIVRHGDIVVDATMGNGHDTAFLAGLGAEVWAFDVQQQALEKTRERLLANSLQAKLILDGHENVDQYVSSKIKGAIFNLGYLPGSDKSVITRAETTLVALDKISKMLAENGRIAIVVYPKHAGGQEEAEKVFEWVDKAKKVGVEVICLVG